MSHHQRDVTRVVSILAGGRMLPDLDDRKDAIDLARSWTHLARSDLCALGRWLFLGGPYPGDKVFVRALRELGDDG